GRYGAPRNQRCAKFGEKGRRICGVGGRLAIGDRSGGALVWNPHEKFLDRGGRQFGDELGHPLSAGRLRGSVVRQRIENDVLARVPPASSWLFPWGLAILVRPGDRRARPAPFAASLVRARLRSRTASADVQAQPVSSRRLG